MKKHIVTCVKCGRQFDANEGGAYYPESRRYVCKHCVDKQKDIQKEQAKARKAAEREELERNGYRTARVSGKIQTRMGNEKKYDMSKAQIAGIEVRQKNAMQWLDQSAAFKRAKNLWLRGKTRREIVAELGELYDVQPEIWGTRKGKRVTEATLSRWLSNMPGVAL